LSHNLPGWFKEKVRKISGRPTAGRRTEPEEKTEWVSTTMVLAARKRSPIDRGPKSVSPHSIKKKKGGKKR